MGWTGGYEVAVGLVDDECDSFVGGQASERSEGGGRVDCAGLRRKG